MTKVPDQGLVHLALGDCVEVMAALGESAVDAIVCDPPYGLGFMGREWDALPPGREWAAECLRVLKPGGHLLAFSGTRTYHRLAVAVEDAGFEIRDMVAWMYGSGYPKSLDVAKAIDKLDAAAERDERARRSQAWLRQHITAKRVNDVTGTDMGHHLTTHPTQPFVPTPAMLDQLRPLLPAVPDWLEELVADRAVESANMASREVVAEREQPDTSKVRAGFAGATYNGDAAGATRMVPVTTAHTAEAKAWEGWGTTLKPAHEPVVLARKPLQGTVAVNVLAHGTGALNVDGCRIAFRDEHDEREAKEKNRHSDFGSGPRENRVYGEDTRDRGESGNYDAPGRWPTNAALDPGAAGLLDQEAGVAVSRFFYVAKPDEAERNGGLGAYAGLFAPADTPDRNDHPTVKPVDLMRWLVRLVTPPGGIVLDPFLGSGTTAIAALLEHRSVIGIEREPDYLRIARARIAHWAPGAEPFDPATNLSEAVDAA